MMINPYLKNGETRKPTYKKWQLDFRVCIHIDVCGGHWITVVPQEPFGFLPTGFVEFIIICGIPNTNT